MIVAFYGRAIASNLSGYVQQFFDNLRSKGMDVLIYEPLYHYLKNDVAISGEFSLFNTHDEIDGRAKILFSLGGDGTLLETLELVRSASIPVMGINTGRLGFLSSISKEEIDFAVDAVVKENYFIDKRTMMQIDAEKNIFGDVNYALNDITISKSDSSSMITTHAYLNGEFLNSYYADG